MDQVDEVSARLLRVLDRRAARNAPAAGAGRDAGATESSGRPAGRRVATPAARQAGPAAADGRLLVLLPLLVGAVFEQITSST